MIPTPRTPRSQMSIRTVALVALDLVAFWAGWQLAFTLRF
jgi:hypothetical protein